MRKITKKGMGLLSSILKQHPFGFYTEEVDGLSHLLSGGLLEDTLISVSAPMTNNVDIRVAVVDDEEKSILFDSEGRLLKYDALTFSTPNLEKRLSDKIEELRKSSLFNNSTCTCGDPLVYRGYPVCATCDTKKSMTCSCKSEMVYETGAGIFNCPLETCKAVVDWTGRVLSDPLTLSPEDIKKAQSLLSDPLLASLTGGEKLAEVLKKRLETEPAKVLPIVIGDKTPQGRLTVEARLKKLRSKKRKKRKIVKRKKQSLGEAPDGVEIYTNEDSPEGEDYELIHLPREGGPTIDSSEVEHHPIKYPTLNPIQSLVYPLSQKDCNLVIAASTSAGKTITAELVMADAINRGGKAVFLSPLKAVSQEKYNDWTKDASHPWYGKRVEILTGDYQLSDKKRRALKKADVIVMTSEMLDSKTRNLKIEGSEWLLQVLVMVVDEAHLLTMEGRGDALECGLMRFTLQNPFARVVLLSATMPNIDEMAKWLTVMNGKKTRVISSDWRPTKLTTHWLKYPASGGPRDYHKNEQTKRRYAINLLEEYPDDKWIIFVHAKAAGRLLETEMKERGMSVEFHNGELDKDSRARIEDGFRDGNLQCVIATSTLAYGINAPARRVLVLGVHRGINFVDPIDVKQMIGRAGRVGYDDKGDAYILIPDNPFKPNQAEDIRRKFSEIGRIKSTINTVDNLAFHLTAEIAIQNVTTKQQAVEWHERSLAHYQGLILEHEGSQCSAENIMDKLAENSIIRQSDDDPEKYSITNLGRVASWLYFSPFDISDWARNFRRLEILNKHKDPTCLGWALGNISTRFQGWIPKDLKQLATEFTQDLHSKGISVSAVTKESFAYEYAIRGFTNKSLKYLIRSLAHDSDRVIQALKLIDARHNNLFSEDYWTKLGARIKYGCSWEEADLCTLTGVGARRAEALVESGIRTIEDVVNKAGKVKSVLGSKVGPSVVRSAKARLKEGSK